MIKVYLNKEFIFQRMDFLCSKYEGYEIYISNDLYENSGRKKQLLKWLLERKYIKTVKLTKVDALEKDQVIEINSIIENEILYSQHTFREEPIDIKRKINSHFKSECEAELKEIIKLSKTCKNDEYVIFLKTDESKHYNPYITVTKAKTLVVGELGELSVIETAPKKIRDEAQAVSKVTKLFEKHYVKIFLVFVFLAILTASTILEQGLGVQFQSLIVSFPIPFSSIFLFLVGIITYLVRQRFQFSYGVIECIVGILISYFSIIKLNTNALDGKQPDFYDWLIVMSAIYIIVRGLDNMRKGMKSSWKTVVWDKVFGK